MEAAAAPLAGRTAWARHLALPVREYLSAEIGSAVVLLAATVAALVWANVAPGSYHDVWETNLSVRLGSHGIDQSVREWVNDGLMAFFFFVVGLEARREFDMGELRERRRVALPIVAALGGMTLPILIYLAFNAGGATHGWGAAMSTDTAFALGALALVGRNCPGRLRVFLLTLAVVDDVLALVVIAIVYTDDVAYGALAAGVALFGSMVVLRVLGFKCGGVVYVLVGVTTWIAIYKSGIDPVIVGLALGLFTSAYPAVRNDLERATELFRAFREQPTPELAREARLGVDFAISPNERLQQRFHPWTSYLVVPLFALANAGIEIDGSFLRRAVTSPITLGILVAYVVGKPVGIVAASWLGTRLGLRRPVAWPSLAGGGTVAGIGFTVSLLIATLAFHGDQLQEAKLGVLGAAAGAALASWLVFRVIQLLPAERRYDLGRTTAPIVDLDEPVDPTRDHLRGPDEAPVTLLEYGDFECPYCGRAEPIVRELINEFGDDLRYVFRHLPLGDVHPHAQLAAEAVEAAGAQGAFWEMHDWLFEHQDELRAKELLAHAEALGLDTERFTDELRRHVYAPRIAEDVDGADRSGVSGTPTFFVNGRRHQGAYDLETLTRTVSLAHARARATA